MSTLNTNGNANIEAFLMSTGELEIEQMFALRSYLNYLQEIELLRAGSSLRDLGITQRYQSAVPSFLQGVDAATGYYTTATPTDLQYEKYGYDTVKPDSILLLRLKGVMRADSMSSTPGMDVLVDSLRMAYGSKNIAGVVIESTSGGGESMAGTVFKGAIKERNKPVIGYAHMAGSAAYRALSGADEIVGAEHGCSCGSIGTMVTFDKKLLAEIKENLLTLQGATAPEKNAEWNKLLTGDFSGVQSYVDEKTLEFQREVIKDRNLASNTRFDAKETVNGKMWDGADAKKRGLIDAQGNMQFAIKRVFALQSRYK